MSLLSDLIPQPYAMVAKFAAIAIVAGVLFFTGFRVGMHHVEFKVQKQIIREQGKTIVIHDKQTVIDTSAVTALQRKNDALQARNDRLQSELSKKPLTVIIPATKTAPAQCYMSKSWVDLYNQSVGDK